MHFVSAGTVSHDSAGSKQRSQVNEPYLEMYEYCRKHADNFYFIDVYSSVLYSEKMFADVDNTLENYDIMGGWACKSPLQIQKYAKFGFTDKQRRYCRIMFI